MNIKIVINILASIGFILFVNALSFSQANQKIIIDQSDQIHFTIINRTSVTFDWVGTADHIRYGADPKNLTNSTTAVHPGFLPVTSPWVSEPGPYWEARLSGLREDTEYYYKIGISGKVMKFRTPPLPGSAGFRICTTSDSHEPSPECIAMFNQIALLKPALVLTTGDITGAGPDGQKNVGERFHESMVWSQSAAWMPAWGNHDWEYTKVDDLRTYKGRFDIPNPGTISSSPAISCCGEDWGWFDYGNTRFVSYPEPWADSTLKEWRAQVEQVFSAADKDPNITFVVTYGHRSAYTSTFNRSPGETRLRVLLDGLHTSYQKYKLDLSGHNHQYERYQTTHGMNYIVNSTTGSYYHEGWDSPIKPEGCSFRAIHYGVLVLDISKDAIQGRFICSNNSTQSGPDYMPLEEHVCDTPGREIDVFTIPASNK